MKINTATPGQIAMFEALGAVDPDLKAELDSIQEDESGAFGAMDVLLLRITRLLNEGNDAATNVICVLLKVLGDAWLNDPDDTQAVQNVIYLGFVESIYSPGSTKYKRLYDLSPPSLRHAFDDAVAGN